MLSTLRRAVGRIARVRSQARLDRFAPMLIDAPDARARIAALRVDDVTQRVLVDLHTNGLAVLRQNVPMEVCDAVLEDFRRHCAEHPEHEEFRDEYGLHDRLACMHMASTRAMQVGLNDRVLRILDTAFERPAVIVGSLFFERGSEQNIHRDTPAFFTVPLNHFFGVWTALEDIHPDSGQLHYYAGGHRAIGDREFVGVGLENMEKYFDSVVDACLRQGRALTQVNAKQGDTVIWHPQLPHGGSPIKNRALSRKSIVFHYVPEGVPCYGAQAFFGPQEAVQSRYVGTYLNVGDRCCFDQGHPRFFRNRREGNFKVM